MGFEIILKIQTEWTSQTFWFNFHWINDNHMILDLSLFYINCQQRQALGGYIMKTHVRGFFDTDLHEVSWHFATHEAVRPSGF